MLRRTLRLIWISRMLNMSLSVRLSLCLVSQILDQD